MKITLRTSDSLLAVQHRYTKSRHLSDRDVFAQNTRHRGGLCRTGDVYRDLRQRCSLTAFLAATPLGQAVLADHKGLQMLITAMVLVLSLDGVRYGSGSRSCLQLQSLNCKSFCKSRKPCSLSNLNSYSLLITAKHVRCEM